jgi:aminoglycoside 6'-N-acetyltransferase I
VSIPDHLREPGSGGPVGVEIRLLGPLDADLLANVAPDVFDDPIDPARTREFLADGRHHLVVAVDDGLVVGFVSAVHYVHPDKPRPELWINEVAVAASHRGRGVGKAMMRAMAAVGRDAGCAEAWVLTDRLNPAAMRLYASSGAVEDAPDAVMFTYHLDELFPEDER